MTDAELIRAAKEARARAYAPYSGFSVGAALLSEGGEVYLGCNIENAAYAPSVCAERVAFYAAISDGALRFRAIAIMGAKEGEEPTSACPPCGVCRQVMAEFCDPTSFRIVLENEGEICSYLLQDLFPVGFYGDRTAEECK